MAAFSGFIGQPTVIARNITGANTFVIKAGPGILHRIIINAAGTTATLFDNTAGSGPQIGALNLGANFPVSVQYQAPFITGLTIVTTGAACNLTIVFE